MQREKDGKAIKGEIKCVADIIVDHYGIENRGKENKLRAGKE